MGDADSTPSLVDIQGDGAIDLVVGSSGGKLVYYRNVGSMGFEKVEGAADDADWSWTASVPSPAEYHVNHADAKTALLDPRSAPTGGGVNDCNTVTTGPCTTTAYVGPGARFYQVLAACGPLGADEGPY